MQGDRMKTRLAAALAFVLPALGSATAASAQEPAAVCRAPVAPTGELAPWTRPAPFAAGRDGGGAPRLALGQAVNLTLPATAQVRFAPPPSRAHAAGAHAGLVAIDVPRAGTYRVALSTGVWVDVIRGGKAVASTAHGHGAACTGIRKIVDFALTPGRHVLQLSGSSSPSLTALVVRRP